MFKTLSTKIPPPVYALLTAGLMWWLNKTYPLAHWDLPILRWAVIALVIIGLTLDLSSLAQFIKNRTTVNPIRPRNTKKLVVNGFYRFTRNPMYLGMLCLLTAWALHLASLSPLLVLPLFVLVINEMQIKPEEAALQQKFGEEYTHFRQRVRRWI